MCCGFSLFSGIAAGIVVLFGNELVCRCWRSLPGMWGLYPAVCVALGQQQQELLEAVSSASACGEVSAACTVLTSAFGHGAFLVALRCILVSMLKSKAL